MGWAPLPPRIGVVSEGRPITGAVDVSFGIGPLYYNFVDIRYIGEPVLRGRIIEPRRNVTIINQTVNVTNIIYNNTTVINNGPNLERVNRFSKRPIASRDRRYRVTSSRSVDRGGGAELRNHGGGPASSISRRWNDRQCRELPERRDGADRNDLDRRRLDAE